MSEVLEQIEHCPLSDVSPMHPDLLRCPAVLNRRLREEAPVFRDPLSGIHFISRYDDVVAMAQDPKTFSSVMGPAGTRATDSEDPDIQAIMAEGYRDVPTMLTQDPPLQRRYRKFVDSAFAPSALKALEPMITAISHELIDRFEARGTCEFLNEFGVPLPLTVIASQIGTPIEDLPKLRAWTEAFIGNLSQQLDAAGIRDAARGMVEFQHYFVERMDERRARPTDDILSMVINASIDRAIVTYIERWFGP